MAAAFNKTISGITFHFRRVNDRHFEVTFDYNGTAYRIGMKHNGAGWKIDASTIPIDIWYMEDALDNAIDMQQ